jgi:hypothetical protein
MGIHSDPSPAGSPAAAALAASENPFMFPARCAPAREVGSLPNSKQRSRAIVTFKEPPSQVYQRARMSDFLVPYFSAIHEYLHSGNSRSRPVREDTFPEPCRPFFPPAAGTVVVYLRHDVRGLRLRGRID